MPATLVSLDPTAAVLGFGIAPRPAPALDRALDATEQCLARHGVRRTTMSDIAREMGVSRPTLYKHLSSVEHALALVASRQLYRFLDELQALLARGAAPETFVQLAVAAVTFAQASPVVHRLMTNEPDLVGRVVTGGQLGASVDQVVRLVAPLLEAAMKDGLIRKSDPVVTAELVVRLCGSLVLCPSIADLDGLVRAALLPLLDPATGA